MPSASQLFTASAAIVVAGFVIACGGGAEPTKSSGSDPEPVSVTSGAAVPSEAPAESTVATIGANEGFTYDDGLKIQVLSAVRFRPSQYAAGHKPGNAAVKFVVRITNGSKEVVDLSLASVRLRAGANGLEAESIFDDAIGGFDGSVAPGRNASTTFGFSVPPSDMGLMNIEVSPSFSHEPSIFEGTVK